MQKRRLIPSFFCTVFCIRFVVFGTNTCFVNCSPFCFVAMHTLENQCVARQLQSKFQLLPLPCCFACLRFIVFAQKSILHIFCFYVYAQYTNRKPCVSKVMQSKFQHIAIKISTLAFALLLCLLAFFCTKTCFANCFFVWLPCGCSQLCVCKVLSDICCFRHVGTLLHRHFAFLTLHFCCFTKQQIRFSYLLLSSTFQLQKIVFVIFFAFEITCALQKCFAYCLVLGRICRQAKAASAMCCTF